jgi:hypothetical protein
MGTETCQDREIGINGFPGVVKNLLELGLVEQSGCAGEAEANIDQPRPDS